MPANFNNKLELISVLLECLRNKLLDFSVSKAVRDCGAKTTYFRTPPPSILGNKCMLAGNESGPTTSYGPRRGRAK